MRSEKELEQAVLASKIVLTLSVYQINQLLSVVGKFPFEEVQSLIREIQESGQPQINATIAKLRAEDDVANKVEDITVV